MPVEPDTTLGAGQTRFPPTAWSLIERLRDPRDPRVQEYLNRMIQAYWRPLYKYLRIKWKRSNEDSKDLIQAFFVHLLEGNLLAQADPDRGNFRKLLVSSLRNFITNEARAAEAVKRGGGKKVLSLDADETDPSWASVSADPDAEFEAQWAREILERSIERLQERARPEVFRAFQRFHLEGIAVKDIARELGHSETQVAHHLQDARAALRRLVTDEIREYVQDDSEIARELDDLFRGWR
jgi:RNA polymerase sigma-70 factor (ECF subfamily)